MKLSLVLLVLGSIGLFAAGSCWVDRAAREGVDVQTTYYPNGNLRSRCAPGPDGAQITERWHPNGTKQAEGVLVAGRMEGEWHWWSTDGSLDAERSGTYHDGSKQSR